VVDGVVSCAVQYGNEVIIGGRFSQVGGIPTGNIALWDGKNWSALGQGTDGDVMALAVLNGELIVGGMFTHAGGAEANGVARWAGGQWSSLGAGLENPLYLPSGVLGLALQGNALIAGGRFSESGTTPLRNIARWNGTAWSALGDGINGDVEALTIFADTLFVGGAFDSAGATPARSIAKWDGSTWSGVGGGVGGSPIGYVYTLTSYKNRLFAGGQFEEAGGVPAQNLAAWDGAGWEVVGTGIQYGVSAFAEHQGVLFIAGGYGSETLATWDDSADLAFVSDLFGSVTCLLDLGDAVLVGGVFTTYDQSGQFLSANLMRWQTGTWFPLETWNTSMHGLLTQWGNPGGVRAMAILRGNLVASGAFSIAGSPPGWKRVGSLAQWDGHQWNDLPPPPAYYAEVLLAHDDTLYVGGTLYGLGDAPSPVARLEGSTWVLLDTLSLDVRSMAFFHGDLYIGGWRLGVNSARSGGVYRWDGSRWQPIGPVESVSEFPGVLAMTEYGGELVVGGLFSEIGGVAATNIAAWNGTRWAPLGAGLGGPLYGGAAVYSLVAHKGTLIAGGEFSDATIAQWDGSTWRSLGRIGTTVALASIDGELFAGGWFWIMGNPPYMEGVAHWDGRDWQWLGSGTNQVVWQFAAMDGSIYMGGGFTQAGARSAFGIARWDGLAALKAPAYSLSSGAPNPFQASATFAYTLPREGHLRVAVFDSAGRQVAVLEDRSVAAGLHRVTWNGRDARGSAAPAGVYFVRAGFPDGTSQTRKTVRVR
jgi:hypothetical protein